VSLKNALKDWFKAESVIDQLPYLLLLMGIGLFNIYNNHKAENQLRAIAKTKSEVKELKWQFLEAKNDLEQRSVQSKLAVAVARMELKPLTSPPQKLTRKVKRPAVSE
jgi:hypothetical protein